MTCVVAGACLKCSCSSFPSLLNVLPVPVHMAPQPIAHARSHLPFVNIMPFVECTSLKNPLVASIFAWTGNKKGPCIPMTLRSWQKTSVSVSSGGHKLLTPSSTLSCQFGGTIKINAPGQACVRTK